MPSTEVDYKCRERIFGMERVNGAVRIKPTHCVDISICICHDGKIPHTNNTTTEKPLENFNFSKNYFWSAGSADSEQKNEKNKKTENLRKKRRFRENCKKVVISGPSGNPEKKRPYRPLFNSGHVS